MSGSGHIPPLPGMTSGLRSMTAFGPLARSVEDLRLSLSLIAGPDGQDWEIPPASLEPPPEQALREYRFAWTDSFGEVPVTADTKSALEKLAEELTQQGCCIEHCHPLGVDFTLAWQTWGELAGAMIGVSMPPILRFLLRMQIRSMPGRAPINRGLIRGAWPSLRRYARSLAHRNALIEALERFLSDWDAWICPVATGPAFTHRKMGAFIEVDGHKVPYLMGASAYTTIFNLTGNPVVVLPLSRSKEGLPIGVQVVGRRWRDMELLAIATQLAEVTGPFQRPPGY